MFVINRFADAMIPCRLCGIGLGKVDPFTPYFFIKVFVQLYVILGDGRHATVAELRKVDKLDDEVQESGTSFRGWV